MKSFRALVITGFCTIFLLSGCNGHRLGFTFKPWGYLIHADKNYRHGGAGQVDPASTCECESSMMVPGNISRYSEPPQIKIIPQK